MKSKLLLSFVLVAAVIVGVCYYKNARTTMPPTPVKQPHRTVTAGVQTEIAINGDSVITSVPAASQANRPVPAVLPSVASTPTANSPLSVAVAQAKPAPATTEQSTFDVTHSPTAPITKYTNEVAATHRMYAAHAPLRAPAVANPDSVQNRQILQTMVNKALSRANGTQSTAAK